MANYYETARSNYFKVKDNDAFETEMARWGLAFWKNDDGLYAVGDEENGFPSYVPFEDGEVDGIEVLRDLIAEDATVVLMGVGSERLRYVGGWATVIRKEFVKTVSLDEWVDSVLLEHNLEGVSDCSY